MRRNTSLNMHAGMLLSMLAIGLASILSPAHVAHAVPIAVSTTADETVVDGNCSLREAILSANSDSAFDACAAGSGSDTISLPSGVYTLRIGGTAEDAAATGDLDIASNLTITGAGATTTFVDGGGLDRVFDNLPGVTGQIVGITIRNGLAGNGSGIHNAGTLTVISSAISGNIASSMSGNAFGGGIHNDYGSLTLINTTVSGNRASASGGAGSGGGIINFGTLTATNSTFSGNTASNFGGGIYSTNGSTLTLSSSTFSDNSAGFSGGGGEFFGTVRLKNTILAGNLGPAGSRDCDGTATSQGYNLLGNNSGCMFTSSSGDLVGTGASPIDPLLGPLENNGGTILTQAPLDGSPAIDQGNPSTPGGGNACPVNDQIGTQRPQGARCDIGAVEIFPTPTITGISPSSATAGDPGFTLTINGTNFVNGATVRWNGADRATTFINNTQLNAGIATADLAMEGAAAVTVHNPSPGGGLSNASTFTIKKLTPTYMILGRVRTSSGAGVPGITVSAGAAHTVTTGDDGSYTLSGLFADTYTITPISSLYIVTPKSRAVSVPPSVAEQNFTAIPSPVYLALVRTAPPPPPPPTCKDDIEPNDRPDQARPLTLLGQPCTGSFQDDEQGQDDYYRVQLAAGQMISIDLKSIAAGADYDLVLYDAALTQLAVSKFPGQDDEHILPTTVGKTGRYYIRVFMRTKSKIALNSYVLQVTIT